MENGQILRKKHDNMISFKIDMWKLQISQRPRDRNKRIPVGNYLNRTTKCKLTLWLSDTIWRQRSGPTLAEVMACCEPLPEPMLTFRCFCDIHLPQSKYPWYYSVQWDWKIILLKLLSVFPGDNELKILNRKQNHSLCTEASHSISTCHKMQSMDFIISNITIPDTRQLQ